MKRALIWLALLLSAAFIAPLTAAAQQANEKKPDESTAVAQPRAVHQTPQPRDENDFRRGGADLKQGYGRGGKELGSGAAGFGKGMARSEWGDAGRSLGRGAGSFGKNVGVGTARGFKAFGLGIAKGGKSVGSALSGNSGQQSSQTEE